MGSDEYGWGFPGNSRKWHLFKKGDSISLCGRWMFAGHLDPETPATTSDDCAGCVKKREQIKAKKTTKEISS